MYQVEGIDNTLEKSRVWIAYWQNYVFLWWEYPAIKSITL